MPSFAGSFLVAKPILRDPFFSQTVVLLLQHNPEGAFGLIVNRQAPVEDLPFPVFVGGPCQSQGLLLLHAHPAWTDADGEEPTEVAPGIYMGDASCMNRINDAPPEAELRYRLFTGYSGWGASQLEGEMVSHAWVIAKATPELLFDTPADSLWDILSPPNIPEHSLN